MEGDGIIQRKREPSNRLEVKRKRITLFKIMRFNSILNFLQQYSCQMTRFVWQKIYSFTMEVIK